MANRLTVTVVKLNFIENEELLMKIHEFMTQMNIKSNQGEL